MPISAMQQSHSGESSFAENAACTAFLTKKHVAMQILLLVHSTKEKLY
ncbi:UNVERIFIED_CONTAM: hypothetical protein LBW93_01800 [Wolbachia endosymbiont of Nasonia longicornis]